MPTYEYRREDGTTFEIRQRITADPLKTCPETGQQVERVISGAGLIFKGEGFYVNDYARAGSSKRSNGSSNGTENEEASSESSTSDSTASAASDDSKSADE